MRRYVPNKLMSLHGRVPVVKTEYIPKQENGGDYPILKTMGVVVCTLANGEKRHFGVEHAYIDSYLRMVAVGGCVNTRNEVVRSWPRVRSLVKEDHS